MKLKQLLGSALLLSFTLLASTAFAQDMHTVSGIVTEDDTGMPLPGVNITIQGEPERGTTTNMDGEYTVRVANPDDVLIFTFIGFLRQEVPIEGRSEINVELISDVAALDELIVIGYGVRQRQDNTGSVNTISTRDFNPGAITSPQDLFQGRAAGVEVTSADGAPGSGATIRIRGGSSLSASNEPLFVVDGIPLDDAGIFGMRNPLNTINPNDIESITVLKDASAAAIYGSRASNGVIIITTKRGEAGQDLEVAYTGNFSYQVNRNTVDVFSPDEFRAIVNGFPNFNQPARDRLGNANTDWQDEVFRNAFSQDHSLSFTGSTRAMPYRFSLGFSGNQGVLRTDSNNRLTGSVALNPQFLDGDLRVNLNLRGMRIDNDFADQGAIGAAVTFDPTQSVMADDVAFDYGGYFTWLDGDGRRIPIAPANPVALLEQQTDQSSVHRALGNLQLDYDLPFLNNVTATVNAGFDYSDIGTDLLGFISSHGQVRVPENAAFAWGGDGENDARGSMTDYTQRKENQVLDIYFNYSDEFPGIRSELDFTGGYSWEYHFESGSNFSRSANSIGGEPVSIFNDTRFATEYYIVSFFGRANYTFNNRYLFTATLRNDGTSRFSEDERWGLFPSFAFAWRLHDESFLRDVEWLRELRLRLGYGVTGQQRIGQGNYPYLARYTLGEETASYQFGNEFVRTLRPEGFNQTLKWEETTTYNIAIDYSIFDERFFGSLEVYQRTTDDLLNVIPVPAGTNFTNRILSNVGSLEVRGIEFDLTSRILSTEDMFWQVSFNMAYNKDEIKSLTVVDDPAFAGVLVGGIAGGVGNTAQIHSVGHPRSTFYLLEQMYDQNGRPIEGMYVDHGAGNNSSSDDNLRRLRSPAPDFSFGLSSRFEYHNWDASFSARANVGNYVYNNVASNNGALNDMRSAVGFLRNATTGLAETLFSNPRYLSDFYLEDASFIKLDNVSVGYTFHQFLDTVSSFRVSATVQNVFTITGYSGQDPEVFGGIDNNLYPRPTTFVLGLNLIF